MKVVNFVFCTGYKCNSRQECLRYKKHKDRLREIGDKKRASKEVSYIKSTACISNRYNNFLPDTYKNNANSSKAVE